MVRALNLIVMIVVLGCGGSGGVGDAGTSGTGGGSPSSSSIDEFIGLTCERARTCCAREGFDTAVLADCEAASDGALFDAVRRGTTQLIEPQYGQCLALWRATANVCELGDTRGAGCEPFFRGTIALGGACEDAIECARGSDPVVCLRADGTPDEEPGVCRELTRARAGEACLASSDALSYGATYSTFEPESAIAFAYCSEEDGLYCGLPDRVCAQYVSEGAACSELERCASELYCDEADRLCKRKKAEGSACISSDECALSALLCKEGVCSVPTYADTEVCEGDLD